MNSPNRRKGRKGNGEHALPNPWMEEGGVGVVKGTLHETASLHLWQHHTAEHLSQQHAGTEDRRVGGTSL